MNWRQRAAEAIRMARNELAWDVIDVMTDAGYKGRIYGVYIDHKRARVHVLRETTQGHIYRKVHWDSIERDSKMLNVAI